MAVTTYNTEHLIEAEVYSDELKKLLEDELSATKYVRWLTDFATGEEINIPSIGQNVAKDYVENTGVEYEPLASGNFTFRITEYLQSGNYITNKMKQDSKWSALLEAAFVPNQHRAIMVRVETDVFGLQSEQTAGDTNAINGAAHRLIATGANQVFNMQDVARAKYALRKANVPMTNLVAVVSPEVAFHIESVMLNEANLIYNPKFEGIVREGGAITGLQFKFQIAGVDFYESEYLADIASETIGETTVTNAKACLFFSTASGDITPFIGSWRQMPKVDSEYNKDKQRFEYVTTARYGVALYRPENLVVVIASAPAGLIVGEDEDASS